MLIRKPMARRSFLHGMLGGGAVAVGVPLLDCFLSDSGAALATGASLPVRFGTWFWGLGMNEKIWVPEKVGADYDLKLELSPIQAVKQHVNVFSRFRTDLSGRRALPHYSGWVLLRCGQAPAHPTDLPGESIDVTVANAFGNATRFPSLDIAASGNKQDSYSFRGAGAINPPQVSPLDLYELVFGAEFQHPNSPTFKPNPTILLRKSVLSAVREESSQLRRSLGSADRHRLDEYFTSLRAMELRLEQQLRRPPPALACHAPGPAPANVPVGMDIDLLNERHRLMADILVMALACNQTRVFNMVYSPPGAGTGRKGLPSTHHILSHEDPTNQLGYQEKHSWFISQAMAEWAYLVGALAAVREGDGTLLDHTLIYAHSEHDNARMHSLKGIPMMTAGRAGGRIRSGLHVDGRNEALATEFGLTLLRAMGLEKETWGEGVMRTTRTVREILA